jgi:acyl-CoA synthetase (AMP-forming)/AMP-acid ligase II
MAVSTGFRDAAELIRYQARVRPEQVALTFEGRDTTYGQLNRRASRVANGLRAMSPAYQARVAMVAKNSDYFYEVLFGAAKARDVLVAVNWRLAPAEVAYIVNDAMAEVLFVGEEFLPLVSQIRAELHTVQRVIALGGERKTESYVGWCDRQDGVDPRMEGSGNDVALQLYTSGTTGHPKGVEICNDNLVAALNASSEWHPFAEQDVSLASMPQFHIGGILMSLIPLYAGARVVITREPDPAKILSLIPSARVTVAFLVPAVLLSLMQTQACHQADFSSLKRIIYGGSPFALDPLRSAVNVFGCQLVGTYGLTETTGVVTTLPPQDHDPAGGARMRSCGRPLSIAEIRVVDNSGEELPIGSVGEIVVRSPVVMKGYWRLPEASASVIRDGWLHTGDAGYFDVDGYLYVHDRLKDMIISGGENIYLAEVESALHGHPSVADVAVIGVPDDRWGEAVKAIIVVKPGCVITAQELITYCRERVAHFKAPRSIDFADFLPRNASGKLLKTVLRAPYWRGRERQVN